MAHAVFTDHDYSIITCVQHTREGMCTCAVCPWSVTYQPIGGVAATGIVTAAVASTEGRAASSTALAPHACNVIQSTKASSTMRHGAHVPAVPGELLVRVIAGALSTPGDDLSLR